MSYDTGEHSIRALDGISLDVPREGYTLGLVGESGSGKTTLGLSILNLLDPPARLLNGTIEYNGKNIFEMSKKELRSYRWREISMVYQSAMNSLNPVLRISDPIVEVLKIHLRIPRHEALERAYKLLSEVGIKKEYLDAYPHQLSGGMRQRVVIALALALSPKILIADEPTSALDVVVQKQVLSLLKSRITQARLSVIFITHEISILNDFVERVAVMYRGEIVEVGPHDSIMKEPLHPYTEMLLNSLLSMDSSFEQLSSYLASGAAQGAVIQFESGNYCKFFDRCKYAFERCRVERPKLIEIEEGRWVACHKYS